MANDFPEQILILLKLIRNLFKHLISKILIYFWKEAINYITETRFGTISFFFLL